MGRIWCCCCYAFLLSKVCSHMWAKIWILCYIPKCSVGLSSDFHLECPHMCKGCHHIYWHFTSLRRVYQWPKNTWQSHYTCHQMCHSMDIPLRNLKKFCFLSRLLTEIYFWLQSYWITPTQFLGGNLSWNTWGILHTRDTVWFEQCFMPIFIKYICIYFDSKICLVLGDHLATPQIITIDWVVKVRDWEGRGRVIKIKHFHTGKLDMKNTTIYQCVEGISATRKVRKSCSSYLPRIGIFQLKCKIETPQRLLKFGYQHWLIT